MKYQPFKFEIFCSYKIQTILLNFLKTLDNLLFLASQKREILFYVHGRGTFPIIVWISRESVCNAERNLLIRNSVSTPGHFRERKGGVRFNYCNRPIHSGLGVEEFDNINQSIFQSLITGFFNIKFSNFYRLELDLKSSTLHELHKRNTGFLNIHKNKKLKVTLLVWKRVFFLCIIMPCSMGAIGQWLDNSIQFI